MNEAIRVSMVSLGCARNLVDSEVLLGRVVEEGLQVEESLKSLGDKDEALLLKCYQRKRKKGRL